MESTNYDVIIIGGGAAGLMCAIEAGKRGRSVLLIEHCEKIGKKILISGGGRCNFTNINARPETYVCSNSHFCKSALARFTQQDFIELVEKHRIKFHEKTLGQLFCDDSSRQIVAMLAREAEEANVQIKCNCKIASVKKSEGFILQTNTGGYSCESLVVACGGISIPKMGATGFGYDIAKQFGLKIVKQRAGLVPFVFSKRDLQKFEGLSGIAIDAEVSCGETSFREAILITHRGVSGPAILQISSFWKPGKEIKMDLLPDFDLISFLEKRKLLNKEQELKTVMSELLPKRFVERVFELWLTNKPLKQTEIKDMHEVSAFFHAWKITPADTEGFRTAEVTVGGVDTDEISSKTFEAKKVPGLYFIGEVLDVTGWLGGYNFQWAWASGFCSGQHV